MDFFPESNYILATTGGLGYAILSYWMSLVGVWYVTILWCLILSLTSIWFHVTRSYISYRIDNFVAVSFAALSLYESWVRGGIPFCLALLTMMYGALMFYVGQTNQTFAFHKDRMIATFFHASIHLFSMSTVVIVASFPALGQ